MVNLKAGRPVDDEKSSQFANISRDDAASLMKTDVAGIDRARSVIAHAVSEVVELVDEGKVTVAAAAEIAQQPLMGFDMIDHARVRLFLSSSTAAAIG